MIAESQILELLHSIIRIKFGFIPKGMFLYGANTSFLINVIFFIDSIFTLIFGHFMGSQQISLFVRTLTFPTPIAFCSGCVKSFV